MKRQGRQKRHKRITKKIRGNGSSPRLVVFRSKKHIYVQAINDADSRVILGCSTRTKLFKDKNINSGDQRAAKEIGLIAAERLLAAGIKQISFDRAGYQYHGRVKSVADGLREGGLKF